MDLSIIIVTYNSASDIGPCLLSVAAAAEGLTYETIVVDNASTDQTLDVVGKYARVKILANTTNRGFPGANNQAIRESVGRYVLLLNPDTTVCVSAFQAMLDFMERVHDCGVCGPTLLDGSGAVWPDLPTPSLPVALLKMLRLERWASMRMRDEDVSILSGACMMIRRCTIDSIGLLDEAMHNYEDADYCRRALRAGFRVGVVREAKVVHLVGRSSRSNPGFLVKRQILSQFRYFRKHRPDLEIRSLWVALIGYSAVRLFWWKVKGRVKPSERAVSYVKALHEAISCLSRESCSAIEPGRDG